MLVLDPTLTVILLVVFPGDDRLIRVINQRVETYRPPPAILMLQLVGRLVENGGRLPRHLAAGRFRQFTAQFDQAAPEGQRLNVRPPSGANGLGLCRLDDRAGVLGSTMSDCPPAEHRRGRGVITYGNPAQPALPGDPGSGPIDHRLALDCRAWLLFAAFSNCPVAGSANAQPPPGADPLDRL